MGKHNYILSTHPFDFVYYYLFYEMGVIFCNYNLKEKLYKFNLLIISIFIILTILITNYTRLVIYEELRLFIIYPLGVIAYYLLSIRIQNSKVFNLLGKYSFYIFLIHEPIIGKYISYYFNSIGKYDSIMYVFIISILNLVISIFIYKFMKYIYVDKIIFYSKVNKQAN